MIEITVELIVENCRKAIKAYEESLKVYTKQEFPEPYKIVQHNLKNLLNFCKEKQSYTNKNNIGIYTKIVYITPFTIHTFKGDIK